jgi:hypothetical protein
MSTQSVNENVNGGVNMWKKALVDAEIGLKKANEDVRGWRQAIEVIRKRIADGAPRPGDKDSEGNTDATRN